jgi:hypothetical protein
MFPVDDALVKSTPVGRKMDQKSDFVPRASPLFHDGFHHNRSGTIPATAAREI